MRPPRKALVLAAGYGTRMRPLTDDRPKPLLPFWGRPVLANTLEMLRAWGVRDVVVNAHHLAGELVNWLRLHPTPGLRVAVSFEPGILGTGGPLARAGWFFDAEPFWICNGDVACRLDPAPLLRAHARQRPLATLWMLPDRGPRTVRVREGQVTDFAVRDPGGPDTYTFSGLHLTDRRVLDHMPGETFSSVITAYQKAQASGLQVAGVAVPGSWWADLGTPEQLLQAHRESVRWGTGKRRRASADFSCLGEGVRVSPGAQVEGSVIDQDAVLRSDARVRNAVVGRGTVVRGEVSRLVAPASVALTADEFRAVCATGFAKDTAAECLDLRGSDRVFFRLRDDRRSAIAVRHGTERRENEAFAALARFLEEAGVRAARVRLDRPDLRFLLMEDLGRHDLLAAAMQRAPERRVALYQPVMRLMARLHGEATQVARSRELPLQPAFSPALYAWEHNLFATHQLGEAGGTSPGVRATLLGELTIVSDRLLDALPVLIHRDFQSTNVLLTRRGPALIDFQGMRYGAAAYDLASLLADPYVMLPEAAQFRLAERYVKAGGNPQAAALLPEAAVQRLAQALGAFGRLGALPGTRRFLAYIPPALRMLERFARRVPGCATLAAWAGDRAATYPSG